MEAATLNPSRPLVLVTGAAGSVGGALISELHRRGWAVRCLAHRQPIPRAEETVWGDLAQGCAAEAVCGVEAVVHLAAITHARSAASYESVNVAGTRMLSAASREAGVSRFVHISTRAIDPRGGAYSQSKARAEAIVSDSGVPFSIIRLPEVYGSGAGEGVERMIDQARRGRPVVVVGRGADEMRPVHVDDAVSAIASAIDAPGALGRTYTLGGAAMDTLEVARACVQAFESRSRIVRVPRRVVAAVSVLARILPLPIYPDQLARLSAPKPRPSPEAGTDLAFRPRSLQTGLGDLDPKIDGAATLPTRPGPGSGDGSA